MRFIKLSFFLLSIFFLSCNPNNVTIQDSFGKYFTENKVTGSFGIFDNGSGQFDIYNLTRFRDSAYQPASTFKIFNSLVGLKTGIIENENMIIKWDGKYNIFPGGDTATDWNQDLTMTQAFKLSAYPYYKEVARRIGKDTMQQWLDSVSYGNKKISAIDSFWIDNTLKITADEQLGFVKNLYFGKLPFDKRSQDIVKKVMLQEETTLYKLSYKTGWGFMENGKSIGWIVGWIEENKHPYFFVLNVEGDKNADFFTIRKKILKDILTQQGFMQGKK